MVMDGTSFAVGAVGCLRRVKAAIRAARLVMDRTFHTLLVGEDATRFAVENGLAEEPLHSAASARIFDDWMAAGRVPNYRKNATVRAQDYPHLPGHDTIGMVVVRDGSVACGTSTNGANHKVPGRVGECPPPVAV
jgi:N4-(beta-N-acetylglucosaminyl)-L-asparaginase